MHRDLPLPSCPLPAIPPLFLSSPLPVQRRMAGPLTLFSLIVPFVISLSAFTLERNPSSSFPSPSLPSPFSLLSHSIYIILSGPFFLPFSLLLPLLSSFPSSSLLFFHSPSFPPFHPTPLQGIQYPFLPFLPSFSSASLPSLPFPPLPPLPFHSLLSSCNFLSLRPPPFPLPFSRLHPLSIFLPLPPPSLPFPFPSSSSNP